LKTEPRNPAPPARGLRAGALLVSGVINLAGALLVLFALPGTTGADRIAAAWALVQFISGVWAGVLGAGSPFLHGLVAGLGQGSQYRRCKRLDPVHSGREVSQQDRRIVVAMVG